MSDLQLTPDGIRYIAAVHQRVPRPFHFRWLLPKLCGDSERRWRIKNELTTFGLLPLMFWFVGGGWRGLAAATMVVGLAGVWRFNRRYPILVDSAGMFCALLAADLMRQGWWPLALLAVLVGACARETTPIFAALYAWNPLLLVGLVPVGLRALQADGPDPQGDEPWNLRRQLRTGWEQHVAQHPINYLAPWGGALVALSNVSPQLAATCAVAYAQMLVATDTVRLYQWAFPVVLLAAVTAVPLVWLPMVVALTVASPFLAGGS